MTKSLSDPIQELVDLETEVLWLEQHISHMNYVVRHKSGFKFYIAQNVNEYPHQIEMDCFPMHDRDFALIYISKLEKKLEKKRQALTTLRDAFDRITA